MNLLKNIIDDYPQIMFAQKIYKCYAHKVLFIFCYVYTYIEHNIDVRLKQFIEETTGYM